MLAAEAIGGIGHPSKQAITILREASKHDAEWLVRSAARRAVSKLLPKSNSVKTRMLAFRNFDKLIAFFIFYKSSLMGFKSYSSVVAKLSEIHPKEMGLYDIPDGNAAFGKAVRAAAPIIASALGKSDVKLIKYVKIGLPAELTDDGIEGGQWAEKFLRKYLPKSWFGFASLYKTPRNPKNQSNKNIWIDSMDGLYFKGMSNPPDWFSQID